MEKFSEIGEYNLHTKVWNSWSTPIELRDDFSAVLMDDNLIMVGGSLNCVLVNTVTSFNLRTMVSTEMAPLETSRRRYGVAILNGSIYVIGGHVGQNVLNSVERWDPTIETWSSVAPMQNSRSESGVAVIDGHLYVSGGRCGRDYSTSVEYYDPVENTWRSKAPMIVARSSHCLAAHKGYLFAIGGCNFVFKDEGIPIERYDPRTDIWTTISCSQAIYGFTRYASRGPDLFIVNKSNIYAISSEGSCGILKLKTLPKCTFTSRVTSVEWVAIPYEFSPPESWIKDIESHWPLPRVRLRLRSLHSS